MLRKGQAAMEFLMTYGWAILVVLIAIGALAYFGVLNPSRFLPESCTFGPGLSCDDFAIKTGNSVASTIVIRNSLGGNINVNSLALAPDTGSSGIWTTNNAPCTNPVADGEQCSMSITSTAAGSPGAAGVKFKGIITLTYIKDGVTHNKVGQISTKVEA